MTTNARHSRRYLRLLFTIISTFSIVLVPKSVAFVLPVAPLRNIHSQVQASTSETNEQEVERYRNRAALTESVLKEKMQEMALLKNKVEVLQDVVKKLQSSQQNPAPFQQEELTSKWRAEETKRIEAEVEIKQLQSQLNRTKSELTLQAAQYSESIQKLKEKHAQDRQEWKQQANDVQQEANMLQDKIRALQKEVLDMDQCLETTQGELISVQKRLASREDQLRTLSNEQQRKRRALEENLEMALQHKDILQSKLDDQAAAEEERRESIEIASAAVRAAEKREASLRQEVETLQLKLGQLEIKQGNDSNEQQREQELLQELETQRRKNTQDRTRYRRDYEKKLEAQRETYEAELRLLRRNTTTHVIQIKEDDSFLTDEANQKNETAASKSRKGRRRIWRRVRSLFPGGKG